MPITPLPDPPLRSDSAAVFVEKADTFMAALPTFAVEANSVENALITSTVTATSTTSLTIGTGSKSLTTQTGKAWIAGSWLYIVSSSSITNTMQGQVTAYNSGTGSLTVNVTSVSGAGTFASWAIGLSVVDSKLGNAVDTWLLDSDASARARFSGGGATYIRGYGAFPFIVWNGVGQIVFYTSQDGRSTLLAQGTDAMDAATVRQTQLGAHSSAVAGGTVNAITASFSPEITTVAAGMVVRILSLGANTSTVPTLNVGTTGWGDIVKGNDLPLAVGDIPGAGYWCEFALNQALTKWVLLNPAKGVNPQIVGGTAGAIPYQTGPSATGLTAVGAAGQFLQSTGAGAPTWVTTPWASAVSAITPVTVAQLPTFCSGEDHYACVNVSTSDNRLVGWGRSGGWGTPGGHDDVEGSAAYWSFYPPIPDGVSIVGHTASAGISTFVWLSNGWAYSGGGNAQGQLGHGDTTNRLWLKRVEYFFTNSISISEVVCSGVHHSTSENSAVWRTSTGSVYFSGMSGSGVAGDGGSTGTRYLNTPVQCGTLTGIVGISLSRFSAFAWSASATYSWGRNAQGQLGVGSSVDTSTPQTITGLTVSKVSACTGLDSPPTADVSYSLFLLSDGTVKASGTNGQGSLGDGTTTDRNAPVVTAGLSSIIDVGACGGYYGYSWAITSGKVLYVWGANGQYQLGIGTTVAQSTPTTPVGYVTKSGGVVSSGSPPFQGDVVQVCSLKTNAYGFASGAIYVLDGSGRVWVAGHDCTMTVDTTAISDITRFSECSIAKLPDGEKITKIRTHGHGSSNTFRVFALTNKGRLMVAGNNAYGCALGGDTPGSEHAWVKTFTPVDIRGMNL